MEREYTPRDWRPLTTLEIARYIHKPSSNDSDSGAGENNEDRRQQEAYAEKTAVVTTHHAWTLDIMHGPSRAGWAPLQRLPTYNPASTLWDGWEYGGCPPLPRVTIQSNKRSPNTAVRRRSRHRVRNLPNAETKRSFMRYPSTENQDEDGARIPI